MAKSLGYGKVELKIDGIELEEYLKAFEVEVSEQVGEWSKSEQMQELLSMATEQENCGNSKLKYMELTEFADHKSDKKGKDFLRNYTMLEGINCVAPKSLITEADLEALRERQVQRAKEEKLRQEQQKREEQHKKEWKIVYASTNLSTIEAFVSKYPESKYLETAHAKIAEIKEKLLNEEQEEAEVEAKAKWEAVQNVDKKFYKKALEDFIANYGDSTFVSNAKKELENLARATVTKSTNQSLDFSKADDAKSIERAMKAVQNPSEEDKDKLEEAIKNVYPSLNAKKKKQFVKMKLMIKWLGKERFQKITL
jgi:outer membrane protein assembly factor BamD (BamD/ComL family)